MPVRPLLPEAWGLTEVRSPWMVGWGATAHLQEGPGPVPGVCRRRRHPTPGHMWGSPCAFTWREWEVRCQAETGRGSDHSARTGRAARGQEGGGRGGESRPHPSACPGPRSQWSGGWGSFRCPRGRQAGLFGSHDQGPRAPSVRQPLSAAPSRADVPSGSRAVSAPHCFEKPLRMFLLPRPAPASSLLLPAGPLLLFRHCWTTFPAQALLASDTGVVGTSGSGHAGLGHA